MRITKSITMAAVALLLGVAMIIPSARAGEDDELTKVKLTSAVPLEVPGKVLPAGTYWFTIKDGDNAFSDAERNTIDIYSADRSKLVATVPARPVQRKGDGYGTASPTNSTSAVELRVAEGSGSHPAALLTWFYPSTFTGHQFVYTEREQKRLDEEQKQTIVLKAEKSSDGTYSATYGATTSSVNSIQ